MALPEQNLIPIEPQKISPVTDSQLWQPPPSYDSKETIGGHGLKPYLRLLRIVWTLASFAILLDFSLLTLNRLCELRGLADGVQACPQNRGGHCEGFYG